MVSAVVKRSANRVPRQAPGGVERLRQQRDDCQRRASAMSASEGKADIAQASIRTGGFYERTPLASRQTGPRHLDAEHGVKADRSTPGCGEIKAAEAQHDGEPAVIDCRIEAVRKVFDEIGARHLA